MANHEAFPNKQGNPSEHIPAPPTYEQTPERSSERAHETEQGARNLERDLDAARHEVERIQAEREVKQPSPEAPQRAPREHDSKTARERAYTNIMHQARSQMSAPQRAFSSVIHAPVVDKLSSVTAATIARPSAVLGGSAFAFFITLGLYVIAKMNGYSLSGTETIAAFILGWIIGNVFDFFRTALRGGK